MGNSIISGNRGKAKIMKTDGETFRFKTPATAGDVTGDYPGHVLLDPDAVKRFGVRAKPLDPSHKLKPRKTYFLVETPRLPPDPPPYRRVSSALHVGSAKERLELLMLSRRSVSDLSIVRSVGRDQPGPLRVKVRLSRAQVEKFMEESKDESEVAEKIIGLYVESSGGADASVGGVEHRKMGIHGGKEAVKAREKHVSFAVKESEDTAA